jgi:hypothetical protein
MATLKPCFLDTPAWASILADKNMIVGLPQTAPLTVSNKILAQLSTLLIQVNELDLLQENEPEELIKSLWGLRGKIREALEEVMGGGEKEDEDYKAIICCKDATYLIVIDTAILRILGCPHLPTSTFSSLPTTTSTSTRIPTTHLDATIQQLQDHSLSPQSFISLVNFKYSLDKEIYTNFEIFVENLKKASKVTPFNMRKMAFMCRVMGMERRKRERAPHPVWGLYERAIEGVNEAGWLGRVGVSLQG